MSSRNNRQRTSAPAADTPLDSGGGGNPQDNSSPQSQPLSFTVPTDLVDLPSRGQYYPSGHPLCGVDAIEMRHMTAREEDLLVSQTLIEKGVAIDRLLRNLVVDPNIDLGDLLTGDKNALIVAARISGYGPEYETALKCPACDVQQDFEFDLSQGFHAGAVGDKDELNEALEDVQVTDHGTFLIELPRCSHTVEVRLLTARQEEEIETRFSVIQFIDGHLEGTYYWSLRRNGQSNG